MTYFSFLAYFLLIPLAIMTLLLWRDARHDRQIPVNLDNLRSWIVILLHVTIAVLYTTPWDNYLVSTRVWWYDPSLVIGLILGWVPIEEYIFFMLQTMLTGLWLLWLARRLPRSLAWRPSPRMRRWAILLVGLLWLPTPFLLFGRVGLTTYLALILIWALPPLGLQLAFGADILWRYRRLVVAGFLVPTLYLAIADTLAIHVGIWSISPTQTLGIRLPGNLPLEEALFFLMTNLLIVFGITLALAEESLARLPWGKNRLKCSEGVAKRLGRTKVEARHRHAS